MDFVLNECSRERISRYDICSFIKGERKCFYIKEIIVKYYDFLIVKFE